MKIKNLSEASAFNAEKHVAEEFLEGNQSNVRIIKLAPGTTLPPHRHGDSDLMLFVYQGSATVDTDAGQVVITEGDLVFISHEEELRVSNQATTGVILLAFLTPKFPPRR